MTSRNVQVTFDCLDPAAQAIFWAAVLDYPPPDIGGTDNVMLAMGRNKGGWYRIEDPSGTGPILNFQRVPEPKKSKNRVHLDVTADADESNGLEAEVERLVHLGATTHKVVRDDVGTFFILLDPEGNEFCVVL